MRNTYPSFEIEIKSIQRLSKYKTKFMKLDLLLS